MSRYQDKVVIVTGGTSGIGEGCVRVFVANGSKVVMCAEVEPENFKLVQELNEKGPGECHFIKCDVTREEDIVNLIDETISKFGRIDCLINNAGWHPPYGTIDQFSVEDFTNLLNLNLVGYFATCKYALPHIRKTKGNIINISSSGERLGQKGATTYIATKGGVSALSRALAIDEAQYEVRVNSVSPGATWTPLLKAFVPTSEDLEAAKDTQLLGRLATTEEIGQLCLFLASEGTFCTGVDILASGGDALSYAFKNEIKLSKNK